MELLFKDVCISSFMSYQGKSKNVPILILVVSDSNIYALRFLEIQIDVSMK